MFVYFLCTNNSKVRKRALLCVSAVAMRFTFDIWGHRNTIVNRRNLYESPAVECELAVALGAFIDIRHMTYDSCVCARRAIRWKHLVLSILCCYFGSVSFLCYYPTIGFIYVLARQLTAANHSKDALVKSPFAWFRLTSEHSFDCEVGIFDHEKYNLIGDCFNPLRFGYFFSLLPRAQFSHDGSSSLSEMKLKMTK